MKNGDRVLVAGAAGFIGSHLCDALVKRGCEVIGVDNLHTGRNQNIEHLIGKDNFTAVPDDICEPTLLYEEMEIDYIYNLACPASPVAYQKKPIATMMTNVLGTLNLLTIAEETKPHPTFIQASTSEVYGDPLEHPQKEDYHGNVNPLGPRACYDEGKRAAETLCSDFNREFEIETRIARIFNTYGPRMAADDGRVVSNFVKQALLGRPLTVYGNGTQTRSLCFVSDTVEALIKMSGACSNIAVMNVGNPHEITVIELAERVLARTRSNSRIEYRPLPEDDPKKRKPDISLIKDVFDWQPKVSLNDGLDMTIEWFRKELSVFQ